MKTAAAASRLKITGRNILSTIRPMDWLSIAIAFILLVIISIYSYGGARSDNLMINVQTPKGIWLFALEEERLFSTGPDGSCLISIGNSSARVIESNCPKKICMLQGSIERAGQWLACVPHQVFIAINGRTDGYIDDLSY